MADERRQAMEWLEEMGFVIADAEQTAKAAEQSGRPAKLRTLSGEANPKWETKRGDSAA